MASTIPAAIRPPAGCQARERTRPAKWRRRHSLVHPLHRPARPPTHLSAAPGFFGSGSPRPALQTASPCRRHSPPETGNGVTEARAAAAEDSRRFSTDRQHGSLRVAAEGPDGASVGAAGVPGPQGVQVVLGDLAVQTSAEETLAHPTQGVCGPALTTRDDLGSGSEVSRTRSAVKASLASNLHPPTFSWK